MEVQKIAVKVAGYKGNTWSHFCYVPYDIKDKFDTLVNVPRKTPNYWIKTWLEAFGVIVSERMTQGDLTMIKGLIRDEYKERYPELFIEGETDKQGWLRVWYTSKLLEEIERVGKSN